MSEEIVGFGAAESSQPEVACFAWRSDEEYNLMKDTNGVLLQYLESLSLEKSHKTFVNEANEMRYPLPEIKGGGFERGDFSKEDGEALLGDFDNDNGEGVLKLWTKFISGVHLEHKEDCKKLTFFVRIYVAIIPFKDESSSETERTDSMNTLHKFFLDKSNDFVTDDHMLTLFALPFIPDPKSHPVFSALFQPIWKEKLRSQLTIAVDKYAEITRSIPFDETDLFRMCKFCLAKIAEIKESQDLVLPTPRERERLRNGIDEKEVEELREDLLDFEDRYYKLLKVTAEVVDTLDKYVNGKLEDMSLLRVKVHNLYPELFSPVLETVPEEDPQGETIEPQVRTSNPSTGRKTSRPELSLASSRVSPKCHQERLKTYTVKKQASPNNNNNEDVEEEEEEIKPPQPPSRASKIPQSRNSIKSWKNTRPFPAQTPRQLPSQAQTYEKHPSVKQSSVNNLNSLPSSEVSRPCPVQTHSNYHPSASVLKKSRVPTMRNPNLGRAASNVQCRIPPKAAGDSQYSFGNHSQSQPNTPRPPLLRPPKNWGVQERPQSAQSFENGIEEEEFEIVLSPKRKGTNSRTASKSNK